MRKFIHRKITALTFLLAAMLALSGLAAENDSGTVVRVSTDGNGRVVRVVFLKPISPILEKHCREFVLANWKGPPNSTRDVPLSYKLVPPQQPNAAK